MPLEEYDSKRDFTLTPEPGPAVRSSLGGNLYVIQKHAARRLHYDLRLELDGTLKSWAVPKGPSLDPADKRLAVHVEDHPIDYAEFEGGIPAGEYGAGTVMVWDRGHWSPVGEAAADPAAAYRAGRLKFRLDGEKLRGAWMLLRLAAKPGESADNWLLFKERDDEARTGDEAAVTVLRPDSVASGRSLEAIAAGEAGRQASGEAAHSSAFYLAALPGARRAAVPSRLEPELATLVARPPAGDAWLHEIKFDGYRLMCRLDAGDVRLLTRRGADWTDHFPTLPDVLRRLPARSAVLDGEVVFLLSDGRTSFKKLASALQSGTDPEARIVYYVFDLLYLDGYDLTRVPLVRRKEALRTLLSGLDAAARVRYVDHLQGSGEEFYAQTCEFALEGEVAKRRDSLYRPGRGRDWLKVKCMRRQEFVVAGFSERADGRGVGVGALLLGYRREVGGPLAFAGRVGTGWDEAGGRDLRARLDALRQVDPPIVAVPRGAAAAGAIWVHPELVAEIEYLSWDGVGAFRHASYEGLRLDKPAGEVTAESPLEEPLQPYAPPAAALMPPVEETLLLTAPGASVGAGDAVGKASSALRAAPAGPALPRRAGRVTVAGVSISNPDRVVYPDAGLTKLDVARYYEDVAAWMLPYVSRRPLSMVRCPDGGAGECFYQKHAVGQFPEAIRRVQVPEGGGVAIYCAIDSVAGLISLVQMGALELHVWGSHVETLENPDQLVFDFDPDPTLPFARVVSGARMMRAILDELGLHSFVKTTGGKGLHVHVPIQPTRRWDEVKPIAKAIAEALVRADPTTFIATMSLKKRAGRIFVDYLRNGRGATAISPFSTRRHPGAPVATPLRWDELGPDLKADRYTVRNVRRRLARLREDPWRDYDDLRGEVGPETAQAAVGMFTRRP